jgi:hypothetical protein
MREQIASQQQIRRASLPDNQRYTQRTAQPVANTDDADESTLYDYPSTITGRSVRRYDVQTDQEYTRRLPVPHNQVPRSRPHRRTHPLVYIGILLICSVVLVSISSFLMGMWQRTSDSLKYGYPRSYQIDQNVGHGDSRHPISHFVALNNHGLIEVIEIPGDPSRAKPYLYVIAQISADNADLYPVRLTFTDVDGDGKVDMQVIVNNTVYVLYNIGTTFKESN